MRRAFLLTIAVYAASIAVASAVLPARVPLHFAGSGEPDRWGSRTEALVTFGLVGAGLALLLGGSAALMDRLPLRSGLVNLPHKEWWLATPEREAEARSRLRADLYGLAAAVMVFLAGAVAVTVAAARSDDPSLGWPFMVGVGVFVVGVVLWTTWVSVVRYRPVEGM
ncbi:DUF1648 domain-containing protein [Nocardioides sp. zg-DK7169]|uniref:DUF1648 domain-containing protein n=1 Tax=Nocardioides sp. zg-DK7169 TaxID=2736600 RepID=UPI0015565DA1|nr:DUF1648 domain-containing protein [Nocardioides sp. zg-DK7169]NPC98102.1 DUF1648 domain-containing protein [Nocardioides sp. zg-DK7169]